MKRKILIIEDDHILREEISSILALEGYDVKSAPNGRIGIQYSQSFVPGIILCDIMMPEVDGIQVLSEIRSNPVTSLVQFVFMTALAERDNVRSGMELGADDYLIKPFTRLELLKAVQIRLEKADEIRHSAESSLDYLREQIMTFVPHEMRTPLHAILGFSQIIKEEAEQQQIHKMAELAGYIYSSGQLLLTLINRYNKFIEVKTTDKKELLPEITEDPVKLIGDTSVSIAGNYQRVPDLKLDLHNSRIVFPAERFENMIFELVDNAFKFSPGGSEVHIISWEEGPEYLISIADKGRGIETHDLNRIGAFHQFDRNKYDQQGSGLGLITAKLMAELYGGLLSINTKADEGTRITIRLKKVSE